VITSRNKTLSVWRGSGSTFQLNRSIAFKSWVNAVAYSDCNTVVTGSGDARGPFEAAVWDATTGEMLSKFSKHAKPVKSVAISHQTGLVATADEGHQVCVWQLKSGETVWCKSIPRLNASALCVFD